MSKFKKKFNRLSMGLSIDEPIRQMSGTITADKLANKAYPSDFHRNRPAPLSLGASSLEI